MTEEPNTPDEKELREFARGLFADDEDETDTQDQQQKPPGNVVPREGNNPAAPPDGDQALREFARDLFDRTD